MPSPTLTNLAPSPEAKAFRAVVSVLQSDPRLKAVVRQWAVWDNGADDLTEPTTAQCPFVQLTPAPNLTAWWSEGQHKSNFDVLINFAVPGTHADDLFNLWHAFRSALFPEVDLARRDQVRALLAGLGVVNGALTAQPFNIQATPDSARMLVGSGRLNIKMLVNT